MTGNSESQVRIVFSEDRFVSLANLADITEQALGPGVVRAADVSLGGLVLIGETYSVSLDLCSDRSETMLYLELSDDTRSAEDRLAQLAKISYAIATVMPWSTILWPGSATPIPCDAFVEGLASHFDAPRKRARRIAPRRVRETSRSVSARRQRAAETLRPAAQPVARQHDPRAQPSSAQLRACLYDPVDPIVVNQGATGRISERLPTVPRVSAWTLSICAATLSLPVALPVMANNLVRGEDMRLSLLAVALSGCIFGVSGSTGLGMLTGM